MIVRSDGAGGGTTGKRQGARHRRRRGGSFRHHDRPAEPWLRGRRGRNLRRRAPALREPARCRSDRSALARRRRGHDPAEAPRHRPVGPCLRDDGVRDDRRRRSCGEGRRRGVLHQAHRDGEPLSLRRDGRGAEAADALGEALARRRRHVRLPVGRDAAAGRRARASPQLRLHRAHPRRDGDRQDDARAAHPRAGGPRTRALHRHQLRRSQPRLRRERALRSRARGVHRRRTRRSRASSTRRAVERCFSTRSATSTCRSSRRS